MRNAIPCRVYCALCAGGLVLPRVCDTEHTQAAWSLFTHITSLHVYVCVCVYVYVCTAPACVNCEEANPLKSFFYIDYKPLIKLDGGCLKFQSVSHNIFLNRDGIHFHSSF